MSKRRHSSLRSSVEDIRLRKQVPQTPQTKSLAYELAFSDEEFMTREETRAIRLQLEIMKPELWLRERGINSTVVLFGGARLPAPGQEAQAAKNDLQKRNLEKNASYYDEARKFARLASLASEKHAYKEYVVVTGGGPGVMEAGNKGATEVGAPSIGLNIVLPHEQAPNRYVTPDLCFNFHYFATRKIHFLLRARVIAVFPGGFGTMDEFFETLTLIQTGRMERVPVLLFGSRFWNRVISLDALAEEGTISPEDLDLFTTVDTAQEAWSVVCDAFDLPPVTDEDPDSSRSDLPSAQ